MSLEGHPAEAASQSQQAAAEANAGTLGRLATAGYGYQALREENAVMPKPVPPGEIKPPSTSIGIGEGRGGSSPPPPAPPPPGK